MYCKRPSYGSRPRSVKCMVYKTASFAWTGENRQERQFVGQESSSVHDEWWSVQSFILALCAALILNCYVPQCAVRAAAVDKGPEQRVVTGKVLYVIAFKTTLGTFCHFTKKSKYCVSIEFVTLLQCYVSVTAPRRLLSA